MELKLKMESGVSRMEVAFNRTAYGIEIRFLPLVYNFPNSFNRTAYGIEM